MGRWLGLADETVFGTPVTPPTEFIDCISIGLHPERETTRIPSMAGLYAQAIKFGSYRIIGDIEIHPNSENIAMLLKWLFGAPSTSDDGSNHYKHEFLPSTTLKFGTAYKVDDTQPDATNCLQYISIIPTSVRLEAALNAAVSMTFGNYGQKDAKVALPTVGSFSTVQNFHSMMGKLYWDIAQTTEEPNIDSITLTFTRSIAEDYYAMNDPFLKGFMPGEATLEGSMDLIFLSWKAYEEFWGATTGPTAQPAVGELDLDFKGPDLGGSGEYANHRMRWQMPGVKLTGIDDPFRLRDKIMQTVTFEGEKGTINSDVTMLKVILYNTMSAI